MVALLDRVGQKLLPKSPFLWFQMNNFYQTHNDKGDERHRVYNVQPTLHRRNFPEAPTDPQSPGKFLPDHSSYKSLL